MQKRGFWQTLCHVVKPLTPICMPSLLKLHREAFNSLKKICWNPPSTWRNMTTKRENTGSNHKTHMDCFSPPTIQPHDLSGALKDAIPGKSFHTGNEEVSEEVNKCLRVQNSNWYKGWTHALVSYWCEAVAVDRDCMWKNVACNTYSYI